MKREIIISWSPEMSVGDPQLDKDHRLLLNEINALYVKHKSLDRPAVEHLLSALLAYSISHFHREEALMRRISYSGLHQHVQLHEAFTARIQQFIEHYRREDQPDLGESMLHFLADWWKDHILNEDQGYAAARRL